MVSDGKSSSTWTEYKNDLFDDYEGMESGSHSLTLGRLYAWEKKLYEEVKVRWFLQFPLLIYLVFVLTQIMGWIEMIIYGYLV